MRRDLKPSGSAAPSVRELVMPRTIPLVEKQNNQEAVDIGVERAIALAFAPMHKLAFGVAVGLAAGITVLLATVVRLARVDATETSFILLAQFFTGYTETWAGAFIGFGWAFVVGMVAGWFTAFVRNVVLATWLLVVRVRADFAASRDFLDHI